MSLVIVLNADHQVLHTTSLKHAARMLYRGVAEVHEAVKGETFGPYPMPKVLRLVKYVYIKWRDGLGTPRYSRSGVLRRDRNKCAYCGKHAQTIDHVIPASLGGQNSWLNCVACCLKCNQLKRDRTPEGAGMSLKFQPYVPSYEEMSQ